MILLLFGCAAGRSSPVPAVSTSRLSPTANTAIISPSATQTGTITPTPTAAPTITSTPTQTPVPYLMGILAARQRSYPGGAITIEETLEPGADYFRYDAWYESEGLKIYGLLTIPFGNMPAGGWPAIVFNHGYIAPDAYSTTGRYIAYVDQLAHNGYIVFKIDYRGHDRSQGEARGAYGDPGYTTDVLNAVASLKVFPQVNPEKIGMWGHSMGGYLTLRAMVIAKDIKVGVIWSGVVGSYADMLCCWHHPSLGLPTRTPNPEYHSNWREDWLKIYGSPGENPAFWNAISANSYLADLSGPLQLHHDVSDSEVPVKFSQDLYQELLSAGKTAEYYEYPGDDHNIATYFSLAMKRTIEFFDKYLAAGE